MRACIGLPTNPVSQETWDEMSGEDQVENIRDFYGTEWANTYQLCKLKHSGLTEWVRGVVDASKE